MNAWSDAADPRSSIERNARVDAAGTIRMAHDRIHARPPHDPENWREGIVRAVTERDGHAVFAVEPLDGDDGERTDAGRASGAIELVVTFAVRDLVLRRLDEGDPVGQRVWFRRRGEPV